MSLPRQYSQALRQQLRCHPVWPPTTPVAPGDYGTFVGGIWTRLGAVTTDFGVPVEVEHGDSRAEGFRFHSDGSFGAQLGAEAALARIDAELDISLTSRDSFFVSVAGLAVTRLTSARQVAAGLRERPDWRHLRYYVVSELVHGPDLLFYGSESGASGVKIRGNAALLERFRSSGRLSPGLGFASHGRVDLQIRGTSDTSTGLGLHLFRVRAVGADPVALSFGGPIDDDPIDPLEGSEPDDDDAFTAD